MATADGPGVLTIFRRADLVLYDLRVRSVTRWAMAERESQPMAPDTTTAEATVPAQRRVHRNRKQRQVSGSAALARPCSLLHGASIRSGRARGRKSGDRGARARQCEPPQSTTA